VTTILGVEDKHGCVIAADTQTTSSDRIYIDNRLTKIVEVGEYLIAAGGNGLACDIAQYCWRPPRVTDAPLYPFVVSKVVPSLKKAFTAHGFTPSDKDDDEYQVLLAIRGHLLQIDSGSVLLNDTGIYGIGSGADYAIGAFTAGASVIEAVTIAADNDIYTSTPVQVRKQAKE
jgi:ATP-dependent protease HslVU (ClpYQ) peptidase subunit